ncbi:PP2C family protein-serine/threonine phosphatase [Agrobacterium vitis]|uniref:PP2C family protein-serine/threonine phosphatase n=1 Tax=Agrobacterium vitis TaxID=373 RepID=UPI003D2B5260
MNDILYDRIFSLLSGRQSRAVETMELSAVGSIVGSVRNRNEDVGAVVNVRHGREPSKDFMLALVCDGMGGMSDGREAALIAASSFVAAALRNIRSSGTKHGLTISLASAQRAVFNELRGNGGTTLSAAYVDKSPQAWLTHVGDSRIYAINSANELRQITRDDTIGAALQREHEKRPDNNRLIQFIGLDGELDPQLHSFDRGNLNGLLVTSDGAHSAPVEILSTIAKHSKTGLELVRKMLNVADALGGLDNATAVHIPCASTGADIPQGDHGQNDDVVVTILCSSGQHDIWLAPAQRVDIPSSRSPDSNHQKPDSSRGDRAAVPASKKAKKPKSPRGSAKNRPQDELPLPIEKPVAKLDFSDDGDSKS